MSNKYEFTGETKVIEFAGEKYTVHRIKAIKDFGHVKSGELGGWIEKESNLSHEGGCWIPYEAYVMGNNHLDDNVYASGDILVCDGVWLLGNTHLSNGVITPVAQMSKKYEFTGETRVVVYRKSGDFVNVTLKRIRALRDFGDVKTGDLGGWIEKEDNLSQEGECWVYHHAIASGNSRISGGACIKDNAQIFDNSKISEMAIVSGEARVLGDSLISGTAHVSINACIFGSEISKGSIF